MPRITYLNSAKISKSTVTFPLIGTTFLTGCWNIGWITPEKISGYAVIVASPFTGFPYVYLNDISSYRIDNISSFLKFFISLVVFYDSFYLAWTVAVIFDSLNCTCFGESIVTSKFGKTYSATSNSFSNV